MRHLDPNFAEHLSSSTITTCRCWKLTRSDGVVVAATEHDRPLTFQGVSYEPGLSLDGSELASNLDPAPTQLSVLGALDTDGLTAEDLSGGQWAGARLDIYRVDWQAPEFGVWLWAGRVSDVRFNDGAFTADIVSLKADLEKTIGRSYQRLCGAELGDSCCGVDLASAPQSVCDKRFSTCRNVFQNGVNFRGFPHMPGTDYVLSGPVVGASDGQSLGIGN